MPDLHPGKPRHGLMLAARVPERRLPLFNSRCSLNRRANHRFTHRNHRRRPTSITYTLSTWQPVLSAAIRGPHRHLCRFHPSREWHHQHHHRHLCPRSMSSSSCNNNNSNSSTSTKQVHLAPEFLVHIRMLVSTNAQRRQMQGPVARAGTDRVSRQCTVDL